VYFGVSGADSKGGTTVSLPEEGPAVVSVFPSELRYAAVALLVLGGTAVVYFAASVVIPVVLAVLIGYALDPIVRQLARLRLPRWLAAMVTILVLLAGLGFAGTRLRDRAFAVIESLPDAARRVREAVQAKRKNVTSDTPVGKLQQAATEIERAASAVGGEEARPQGVARVRLETPAFNFQTYLLSGTSGLLGFVGQAVVVIFLVYFLLASGDLYKRKIVRLVGSRLSHKRLTVEALNEIGLQIERFLLVQVLTSILVGVLTWVLLRYAGLENAAVWAIAAGVVNSIPYLGAIVVSAGLALVAFLQFGTFSSAVQIAGGAFVITSLEGMLLTPALMGKAAGINQVAMFVSVLFWTWMWGLPGTLLAVPIMMATKIVCERVEGLQGIAELLNEQ
jgi:predicted PurR-regulated permease PerM